MRPYLILFVPLFIVIHALAGAACAHLVLDEQRDRCSCSQTVDAQTPWGVRCAFNCQGDLACIRRCPGVVVTEVCRG